MHLFPSDIHFSILEDPFQYQIMRNEFCSTVRTPVLDFLIKSAQQLEVPPIVKYAGLSFFAERFYPIISSSSWLIVNFHHIGTDQTLAGESYVTLSPGFLVIIDTDSLGHWLLQPVRESNLQLFALISIWISSKIHDSHPLSVKKLKTVADKIIQEQHYTTRDFADAVLDFEIGTSNIAYRFLEDLVIQLKEVAIVGYHLNFEVCMDIMDLLYEKEETSDLYSSPLKHEMGIKEEEIIEVVRDILTHVLQPCSW
ncbi:Cyclin-like protein [Cynara cardunculus var. scolymus]|uniref:Cyclin-like protein n=1 Tax=Cynara cardunculus var. scolymus TaxID=59895 RepID=A0A103XT33_CYNCS|nr:Cyclin-like protein [Cynara cardunculus var. scolymus]